MLMDMDQRSEHGQQIWDEMLGPDRAEAMREHWRKICPEFEKLVTGFVGGEIWTRPGLDRRTRSLATIAALAALGRPLALELNLRMALNNGATREEIVETLLQIAPYAGFPACWEGLALASKVFEEAGPA